MGEIFEMLDEVGGVWADDDDFTTNFRDMARVEDPVDDGFSMDALHGFGDVGVHSFASSACKYECAVSVGRGVCDFTHDFFVADIERTKCLFHGFVWRRGTAID